jgi:hypothetical protein
VGYPCSIFIRLSNAHFRSLSVSKYGSRTNDGQNPEMQLEQVECLFARTVPPNRAHAVQIYLEFLIRVSSTSERF